MHILLAAATTFEIQPTIDVLGRNAVSKGFPPPLITGVGGVATTWSLMRHIGRSRPDLILQAGIGGSLAGHEPGAVFVIAEDRMADVGVWEYGGFRSPFDMGLADADAPPF
ncbi:MAG TPA: hypothetical protein VHE54_05160, partial [Puia sp.]|nr:hypothetical protein [Puia sp.]